MRLATSAGIGPRRAVVFLVLFLLAIAGVLVSFEYIFQFRDGTSPSEANFSFSAYIDKPSPAYYETGEQIRIGFNVTDYKVGDLTISSPTQCVFGLRVRFSDTEGAVVYDTSKHANCVGPQFKTTLTPGKSFTAGLAWNQLDDTGHQVPPGRYEIMGYFTGSNNSDLQTTELVAGAVYFGTPSPVSPQEFLHNYYISLNTDYSTYSLGEHVRIDEGIVNNGQSIDSFAMSPCSFSYQVFNLTNALVFDSMRHGGLACSGSLVESPVAPQGGLSHSSYWNQTDDSGGAVPEGLYHVVDKTRLLSGNQGLNGTRRWDILIGTVQPSNEGVDILSSSICDTACPVNGTANASSSTGPALSAELRVTGTLRGIQIYLNGISIADRAYNGECCSASTDLALQVPISNTTIPVFRGGAYDIVVVATFQDGKTYLSWADPLLPVGRCPLR